MLKYGLEDAAVVLLLVVHRDLSEIVAGLLEHVDWLTVFLDLVLLLLLYVLHYLKGWQLFHWLDFFWQFFLFGRFEAVEFFEGRWFDLIVHKFVSLELIDSCQSISDFKTASLDFLHNLLDIMSCVVYFSEIGDDGDEVEIFFLHLLVVAATLFGLSCSDEYLHGFEDFIGPAHMSVHEMSVMYFQKPMILLVLLSRPMPSIHVLQLLHSSLSLPANFRPSLLPLLVDFFT